MVDAAALTLEDDVIEVGAGLGALTEELRTRAGRVLAVEIDRAFLPCLQDRFRAAENVKLFRGDILNHHLDKLLDEFLPGRRNLKMVSNLPYYITTPILFHFWESGLHFVRMVVMMQEEVARRMVAAVGTAEYGVLTLAAQCYCQTDVVRRVPRTCFRPQPRVDSCIVRLRERSMPPYPDVESRFLLRLVHAAFGQRRKTLLNSLTRSGTFGVPKEIVVRALTAASIDPKRRAETLTFDEYARLASVIRRSVHG